MTIGFCYIFIKKVLSPLKSAQKIAYIVVVVIHIHYIGDY
jgi:hypothetical protein